MDNEALVDQIVQSLSFEVVAVPQDIVQLNNTSKSAPLNVKIRVRKKNDAGLRHGVLTLPKVDRKEKVPERIRLVSSDQTIMSFNVVMEADFDKVPPKRNQNLSMVPTDVNNEVDNYPSLSKKADNYNTSPILTKRSKDIFGRCKPGGCLDPPFGEDKYSYQPTQLNLTLPAKDETTKLRSSSIFKNNLFRKRKKSSQDDFCKTNMKNTTGPDSLLSLYEAGSLQTPIAYSNSIITYPHPSNSSELRIQEEKPSKKRYSSENKSKSSFSEDNGSYYIIPKKIKKNVNQSDVLKIPQSDVKIENSDLNIIKLSNEINSEYQNTLQETTEIDDDINVNLYKLTRSVDTPNNTGQSPVLNSIPLNTTIKNDEINTNKPKLEHKDVLLPTTKLDSNFQINSYKSSESIDELNYTPKVPHLIPVPLNDDKNDMIEDESNQPKTILRTTIKPDDDFKLNSNKSSQSIDELNYNPQLNAITREDKRREVSIKSQEKNTLDESFNIKPVIQINLPSKNYDAQPIIEVQIDSCTPNDNINPIMEDQVYINDSSKIEKPKINSVNIENNESSQEKITTDELIQLTNSLNLKRFSDLQTQKITALQNLQKKNLPKDENNLSVVHDVQQGYLTEPTLLHKIHNSKTDNSQTRLLSATKQKIISIAKSNIDLINDDSNSLDLYSRNQTDINSHPLVSTREKSMLNVTDVLQPVGQNSVQNISNISKVSENSSSFSTEDLKHIWINDTAPLKSTADVITKTILPSKKSYENNLDAPKENQLLASNTFTDTYPAANKEQSKMESSIQYIQMSSYNNLNPLEDTIILKTSILSENSSITQMSANERRSSTETGLFEYIEKMIITDVNIFDQKSENLHIDFHEHFNQNAYSVGTPDKVSNDKVTSNITRIDSKETLLPQNEEKYTINTEAKKSSNLDSGNDTIKQQPDLLDEYNKLPQKLVSQSVIFSMDAETYDVNKEFPEKSQSIQQYQMSIDRSDNDDVSRQSNEENKSLQIRPDGEHPQNNLDSARKLNNLAKREHQLDKHELTFNQTPYAFSHEVKLEFITQYKDIDDTAKSTFGSEQFPSSDISEALNKTPQPTSILPKDTIKIDEVVKPTLELGQFFSNDTSEVMFKPAEPIANPQNSNDNIDVTSNSTYEINIFPSKGPSKVLYKTPQPTAILQKCVVPWKVDLALQSYTDENNERVIKSFNSENVLNRQRHDALLLAQCFLGGEFNEIKIPIDQQNNLCVQIINNRSEIRSETSEVERTTKVKMEKPEPTAEKIDYEDVNKPEVNKHNKMISGDIRDALTTIYEQELVPLQHMIKGLREEIDMLAANQMKFKEKVQNLTPKRSKPLRLVHVNKKCTCRRL